MQEKKNKSNNNRRKTNSNNSPKPPATKQFNETRKIYNRFKDPYSCIRFLENLYNAPEKDKYTKILNAFPDLKQIIKTIEDTNKSDVLIRLINLISSIESQRSLDFSTIFFDKNEFHLMNAITLYLNRNVDISRYTRSDYPDFIKFFHNICDGHKRCSEIILRFIKENKCWEFYPKRKELKADIKQIIQNCSELESLETIKIYPDTSALKNEIPDAINRFENGYKSFKDLCETVINLEKINYIYPIQNNLRELVHNTLNDNDLHLYENVQLISLENQKDLQLYEGTTAFLHFEPKTKRKTWYSEGKLDKGSILILSRSEFCDYVDALVISTLNSMGDEDDKKAKDLKHQRIVPVKQIYGTILAGEKYYGFEPADIYRVSEIKLRAIKSISNNAFHNLHPQIVSHDFQQIPVTKSELFKLRTEVLILPQYANLFRRQYFNGIRENLWFDEFSNEEKDKYLRVDHEQLAAIRHFVEYPLTLVNGHPGTGKTHLAREAIRLLTESSIDSPIFVVTQTNHSMDSLLEGLLDFIDPTDFVRHGSRLRTERKEIIDRKVSSLIHQYLRGIDYYNVKDSNRKNSNQIISLNSYLAKLANLGRYVQKCIDTKDDKFSYKQVMDGLRTIIIPILGSEINKIYGTPLDNGGNSKLEFEMNDYAEFWIKGSYVYFEKIDKIRKGKKSKTVKNVFVNKNWQEIDIDVESLIDEKFKTFDAYNLNDSVQVSHEDLEKDEDDDDDYDNDLDDVDESTKKQNRNFEYNSDYITSLYNMREPKTSSSIDVVDDNDDNNIDVERYKLMQTIKNALKYLIIKSNDDHNSFVHLREFIGVTLTILTKIRDEIVEEFNKQEEEIDKLYNIGLSKLFMEQEVVAMTASYATMYKQAIEMSNCKFMIIEEAGELTEATTISFLPSTLTNLIMIGDFQQLRPKITYELREVKNPRIAYDISTFERLVRAEEKCQGKDLFYLTVQRRMHPDICNIIRQRFCPNIKDDASTKKLGLAEGLSSHVNVVLNDDFVEDDKDGSRSFTNEAEADYAVSLVFFFLFRGIPANRIAVISLYKGQALNIRKKLRKFYDDHKKDFDMYDPFLNGECTIKDIYVQCIDNYQGEENDVIIVSTVRSTRVGFIDEANRVLVTLSRARKHLVILGNKKILLNDFGDEEEDTNDRKHKANHWPEVIKFIKDNYESSVLKGIFIKCEHGIKLLLNEKLLWNYRFRNCDLETEITRECGHKIKIYCGTTPPPCRQQCLHRCDKIIYINHYENCIYQIKRKIDYIKQYPSDRRYLLHTRYYFNFDDDVQNFIDLIQNKFPQSIEVINNAKIYLITFLNAQIFNLDIESILKILKNLSNSIEQLKEYLPKCNHRCSRICCECAKKGYHEPCDGMIPFCKHGHDTLHKCSDINNAECKAPCGHPLPCGHSCGLTCHHNEKHHAHECKTILTTVCDRCHKPYGYACGRTPKCTNIVKVKCERCKTKREYICGQPTECQKMIEVQFPLCKAYRKYQCGHPTECPTTITVECEFCHRIRSYQCGHPTKCPYSCYVICKMCGTRRYLSCANPTECTQLVRVRCNICGIERVCPCNQRDDCPTIKKVKCPKCNKIREEKCGHPTICTNLVTIKCKKCKTPRSFPCGNPTECQHAITKTCKRCGETYKYRCGHSKECPNIITETCEKCGKQYQHQCGHPCECTNNVTETCERCGQEREYRCGHPTECPTVIYDTCKQCGLSVDHLCGKPAICKNSCKVTCCCGHQCQGKCSHKGEHLCNRNCKFIFPCGHACPMKCSEHSADHQHLICMECEKQPQKAPGIEISSGSIFKPSCCKCSMKFDKAKNSILGQFNSITKSSVKNPAQIRYLKCPECKSSITQSDAFRNEVNQVNSIVSNMKQVAKQNYDTLKEIGDTEFLRHLYKFIYCRCGQVNIFDCSPGESHEFKCTRCSKKFDLSELHF